jgi:predicted flavoprotein YhiN
MAASHAAELGIPALLLERKHRAGSKIMMCGNGRCNLTSCLSAEDMLSDFGAPLTEFLKPAITAFSPAQQQDWFRNHDLPLMRTSDGKVFPKSEKAPDVVRCFTNILRNLRTPICYNAPVENITADKNGFTISTPVFTITAERVLICTGGVSYPKTGSVGDGQKLARKLGHKLQPYRPGLVGIEFKSTWHQSRIGQQFKNSHVKIFDGDRQIGETKGLLECERWGLGGGAISNATRILSRANAKNPGMEITYSTKQPPIIIKQLKTRPLKEAMVTVGGVDLQDIDPATMESKLIKNLYFAGEVLDIDGPTGGYNLTAAFAAARLAINTIAQTGNFKKPQSTLKKKAKGNKHYLNNRKSTTGGKFKRGGNRHQSNRRRR